MSTNDKTNALVRVSLVLLAWGIMSSIFLVIALDLFHTKTRSKDLAAIMDDKGLFVLGTYEITLILGCILSLISLNVTFRYVAIILSFLSYVVSTGIIGYVFIILFAFLGKHDIGIYSKELRTEFWAFFTILAIAGILQVYAVILTGVFVASECRPDKTALLP